jgi:hypothetical protein
VFCNQRSGTDLDKSEVLNWVREALERKMPLPRISAQRYKVREDLRPAEDRAERPHITCSQYPWPGRANAYLRHPEVLPVTDDENFFHAKRMSDAAPMLHPDEIRKVIRAVRRGPGEPPAEADELERVLRWCNRVRIEQNLLHFILYGACVARWDAAKQSLRVFDAANIY